MQLLTQKKVNIIERILNNRLDRITPIFEETDQEAIFLADTYWHKMISKKRIDASDHAFEEAKQMVIIDTLKHEDAREVGAEWLCYQALEQLKLKDILIDLGWDQEKAKLAITQIIGRAIYHFSEYRTSRWIKENSSICEITGYPIEKITKDVLYKSALDLYSIRGKLEQYLSQRTNELFDLEDKIILYDLTNTYFEGQKKGSNLAKFGRSKEKRRDCRLVVLAMVVNVEGFVKYHNIFEGNMSDSQSLPKIIDNLRLQISVEKRAIVVLDAGIASEDNLKILKDKGYDYVCVSRSKLKNYKLSQQGSTQVETANKQIITLQKIEREPEADCVLKVKSKGKEAKESSMKSQFEERFIAELDKINISLAKKHGVKKTEAVNRRIGRVIGKYSSIAKFYNIEVKTEKQTDIVNKIILTKKKSYQLDQEELGSYFIKTSLNTDSEETIWTIYNSIREIESTFRCLKTDLDLRPIYHKNDDATMAHLHLGILAYWLVNTIRHQLKKRGFRYNWQEILRITNTQKIITTSGKNKYDETLSVRRCTEPNEKVKQIYDALNYRYYPFVKRKSVVPKSELKKNENQCLWDTNDG
jgi:hypothetical protein